MFNFFSRGDIIITPDKFNYTQGETIKGTVKVALKKLIKGTKLSLWIMCEKTSTYNQGMVNNSLRPGYISPQKTERTTLYQFELPLDTEKEYSQAEYPFEITIPSNVVPAGTIQMPGIVGSVITSIAGTMPLGMENRRIDWTLEAILDIPGAIDMRKRVQINVT